MFHNAWADSSCTIPAGVYVANGKNYSVTEHIDKLTRHENFSADDLLDIAGSLVLRINPRHQISLEAFAPPATLTTLLYRTPAVGSLYNLVVGVPEVKQMTFHDFFGYCSENHLVLSWKPQENDDEISEGGLIYGTLNEGNLIITTGNLRISRLAFLYGTGDDQKTLHFKWVADYLSSELNPDARCAIPDGLYKGSNSSSTMEIELRNGSLQFRAIPASYLFSVEPEYHPLLSYSCQGNRISFLYKTEEGLWATYIGEYDPVSRRITSDDNIRVLVQGGFQLRENFTLTE